MCHQQHAILCSVSSTQCYVPSAAHNLMCRQQHTVLHNYYVPSAAHNVMCRQQHRVISVRMTYSRLLHIRLKRGRGGEGGRKRGDRWDKEGEERRETEGGEREGESGGEREGESGERERGGLRYERKEKGEGGETEAEEGSNRETDRQTDTEIRRDRFIYFSHWTYLEAYDPFRRFDRSC